MKFNTTWQWSLYTVALLITLIACHERTPESKGEVALSQTTDAVQTHPASAHEKVSAAQAVADKPGASGLSNNETVDVHMLSDSTAVAAGLIDEKNEEQVPPSPQSPRQQSPAPHQPSIQQSPRPKVDWDKKIVKTAKLTVEVKDYAQYNDLVRTAVKAAGGYIAHEEQNESAYKVENVITIKVPVDQFDNAVVALTPGKEKVLVRKITAEDVTGEVVDTRSRLEAKRQVRLRYLDLLKQAKNMEEILQVQNEINGLQENIEAAAGRVQYLMHAASFSTIQLSFFQVLNPTAIDENAPPGFGKRILLALTAGLAWIGELIVLLVTLWPLWAMAAAIWWLVRRYRPFKKLHTATPVLTAQPVASQPVKEHGSGKADAGNSGQ